MYEGFLGGLHGGRGARLSAKRSFALRSHALWGLIAKGAPSAQFAVTLLQRPEAEAREDGAAILGALGADDGAVERLMAALAVETDVQAMDSLVIALGRMGNRRAIPALAALIRDEDADGDTRWTAIESLGRIVRKSFLRREDPMQAARDWLAINRW